MGTVAARPRSLLPSVATGGAWRGSSHWDPLAVRQTLPMARGSPPPERWWSRRGPDHTRPGASLSLLGAATRPARTPAPSHGGPRAAFPPIARAAAPPPTTPHDDAPRGRPAPAVQHRNMRSPRAPPARRPSAGTVLRAPHPGSAAGRAQPTCPADHSRAAARGGASSPRRTLPGAPVRAASGLRRGCGARSIDTGGLDGALGTGRLRRWIAGRVAVACARLPHEAVRGACADSRRGTTVLLPSRGAVDVWKGTSCGAAAGQEALSSRRARMTASAEIGSNKADEDIGLVVR
ncbi:hypothetical protein PHLGIDRAFT_202079 [Phlebiopsis gigantea 11061_1 CR5-6]|uniref:Uncharacterized protein n=1 Tax=Phlebiopsis gigantea (strain 11061_1 CR5-6) TaxID=745531 RepID=A0A0C3S388_PHLG1|nr:hypothetical protein PHLGIDRAFT_202079 [Phlebiopsis gigantea 11061_1 CR5-6]